MRAFLALTLPEPAVEAIKSLQADLPVGRTVLPDNLHLTLAFLGELSDTALEAAHEALGTIQAGCLTLELAGLGTLGGRAPNLAYIGALPNPGLTSLHKSIRSRLHGAGLMLPRERFLPHVTFARFRRDIAAADVLRLGEFLAARSGFRLDPFPVTDFTLFRSTLGPDAPVHDPLAHYPLT